MQPDVKNVSSKAPIKAMEKIKDQEVRSKINTKTSNDTKKAVNHKQQEPNDTSNKNNKKVRELELVELFRASLDPNVDIFVKTGHLPIEHIFTCFREQDWSMLRS